MTADEQSIIDFQFLRSIAQAYNIASTGYIGKPCVVCRRVSVNGYSVHNEGNTVYSVLLCKSHMKGFRDDSLRSGYSSMFIGLATYVRKEISRTVYKWVKCHF